MKRSKLNRRERSNPRWRWQPLERAKLVPKTEAELADILCSLRATMPDLTMDRLRAEYDASTAIYEVWKNDAYQVHVMPDDGTGIAHLSIRRIDRAPVRDWRDVQRIKNQLIGPECEGFELYPAESRCVDLANQYHLWVFTDPEYRIPVGWSEGRHVAGVAGGGAIQRPLEEEIL